VYHFYVALSTACFRLLWFLCMNFFTINSDFDRPERSVICCFNKLSHTRYFWTQAAVHTAVEKSLQVFFVGGWCETSPSTWGMADFGDDYSPEYLKCIQMLGARAGDAVNMLRDWEVIGKMYRFPASCSEFNCCPTVLSDKVLDVCCTHNYIASKWTLAVCYFNVILAL